MGRIERRVLMAALLGAVAMFGAVGFARGGTADDCVWALHQRRAAAA